MENVRDLVTFSERTEDGFKALTASLEFKSTFCLADYGKDTFNAEIRDNLADEIMINLYGDIIDELIECLNLLDAVDVTRAKKRLENLIAILR